jgi:hypothetical protein
MHATIDGKIITVTDAINRYGDECNLKGVRAKLQKALKDNDVYGLELWHYAELKHNRTFGVYQFSILDPYQRYSYFNDLLPKELF